MKTDQAIIFDLDGTLWDSRHLVYLIWNRVFERTPEIQVLVSREDMDVLMGKTMEEIGACLFPDKDAEFQSRIMDECGKEEVVFLKEHGARLFDGVRETVDALRTSYGLYIVSNCQEGYVEAFQEAHGFTEDFADIEMSGRTGKGKAENIRILMERNQIRQAVYVGDTAGDEQAARQAGIPFIYAAYGFGKAEDPDRVIRGIRELPEAVSELFVPCTPI